MITTTKLHAIQTPLCNKLICFIAGKHNKESKRVATVLMFTPNYVYQAC